MDNESAAENEPKSGFFARLKSGLAKTRSNFAGGFDNIVHGKAKVGPELLEELEETLLIADVGMQTTSFILDDLKREVSQNRIRENKEVLEQLKQRMIHVLSQNQKPLPYSEHQPFVILVGLALFRVNAIYTIICTIAAALIITYMHSSPSFGQLGGYLFAGYVPAESLELGEVGGMLSRGGVQSMFFTQAIVILALSLGGLLTALGILPALLSGIKDTLTTSGRAIFAAAMSALSINVLIGEQYLSILLSGTAFRSTFERLHLHPKNLSRTIEDAGTVINPLVPWSVCGVFISQALGVPVLDYLPYAFFCYLSLLLTLVFGFTGLTISRVDKEAKVVEA